MHSMRSGFTLMELIIAITIMGILVVGGLGTMRYLERARVTKTETELNALKAVIQDYHAQAGQYPATLEDLVRRPAELSARKWTKSYDELPRDGWGNEFYYRLTPGAKHPFELYSYGSQGEEADKSEWLSVWG